MSGRAVCALLIAVQLCAAATSTHARDENEPTIKSLEQRSVAIRPGKRIRNSADLARDNYRAFLDLVSDDPELRAEAMRRLGDLELEATEIEQLGENVTALGDGAYTNAVTLYRQLLEAYPDYRRNDTVLYQLARAYEIGGRTDAALEVLDEIVDRYPDTPLIGEVQFRRGEMLFLRKRYADAEVAYHRVVEQGTSSRFYEQSLYKLGWSQFKLALHDESLDPFFELLDRKIGGIDMPDGTNRLEHLSRANQELVEDTFRVLSISFSYMDGADSIDAYLATREKPEYTHVIYLNLGDLYLEKERFVDAADTYGAFVAQDPLHPQAPLLQVEVIEAYKRGGFPSLVLDAKKAFVDRYGMDGGFWQRNPRADNEGVVAHLKANLTDLARYYHAEAQRDGKVDDYQEAARWYRKYLAFFPDEPDTASTNFLLAEILYESGDFANATDEYERTAYAYPPHERSAEAGYAALLAYREQETRLSGEDRSAWHRRYLDSGLRFADAYPEHPQSGAILTTVAESLFADGRFDLAITVAQAVIHKQPPVETSLARTAWTVVAHAQFDLGDFDLAEQSYYELQAYTPAADVTAAGGIRDRIASSIYRQGEKARDTGDLEIAVNHFLRLGQVIPDSEFRATAEYDAAAALINLEAWDRAAGVLENFRRDYPDSEFAGDVTRKLAVAYLNSDRGDDAAAEFERIADDGSSESGVRRDALWKAAELYRQSGNVGSEQRALENVVLRYPSPVSESIEARARLLEIAEHRGDATLRDRRLREIVAADAGAGPERTDRTRYLAAKATLALADPVREAFQLVSLTQPLPQSMKQKRALMEEVIAVYTSAADFGVAEVTTAATYRLGEVYERFGADLLASERPGDLDAEALEQYELLLEEQAYPFDEKAIDLYKVNADRTVDGVYDEWVRQSFERLAGLMPARYAKLERSEDVLTSPY